MHRAPSRGDEEAPRPRSRSRQRSSGRQRLTFGRHFGRRYSEVAQSDPGYCRWALSIGHPQGDLRHFVQWLQRRNSAPEEYGDDDEGESEEEADDLEHEESSMPLGRYAPGPFFLNNVNDFSGILGRIQVQIEQAAARLGELRQRQVDKPERRVCSSEMLKLLIEQLPRVTYSASLFSGTPHPESCPICMEDFAAWESGQASEIVLTPCLHTFHVGCISGWLGKRHECPSCRWDITDLGEEQAMSSSSGVNRAAMRLPENLEIVVSDEE
ncbi:unnamed protein product [Durusdinium trenchii]|uniref:RING-type domain-containing protein n=1 Tax=Durusdinium trenchii TaxID=1381693 RepID=A0ABP0IXV2_9DINO